MQLTVTETVNPTENTSTLKWTLESKGGSSLYYTTADTTVVINGKTVYSKSQTDWSTYAFPAAKGSKSGSLTVAHDSDGSKSIKVSFKTRVFIWEPLEYGGDMELTTIDRTAPTVSFSADNITTSGFEISASASTKCDEWDYSLDNGSTWKNFSTTDGTSASVAVPGLTVNTSYNVKVRARRTYNHVYGTSSQKAVKTLGFATVSSCDSFYVDAATAQVKPKVTVYESSFDYYVSIKDGSTTLFSTPAMTWAAGTATRTCTLTAEQKNLILAAMPNDKEKSFAIIVHTYEGSTLIGTHECSVTAKTSSADSAPTFTGFDYGDTSDLVSVTGDAKILIQGFSTLKVTATAATAKNYATIASYTATIADKTVKASGTEIAVGTVGSPGTLELTVTAIDSRGWSTSVKKSVTVLEYAKPKLSSITLRRANGIDAVIQLSFLATMSVIKPDGVNDVNSLVNASYRYKLTSAGDDISDYSDTNPFTSQVERSASGTYLSFATNELFSLDADKSYDFRLVIKDKVSSSVTYHIIPKGIPLMAIRKDKLGINNPDPKFTLDVEGDINLTGEIYINGKKLSEVLGL